MAQPNQDFSFPPTVLQVIPELDAGGAERTTVDVAAAVIAAGGKAIVVSRGGRLAHDLEEVGATLVRMPVHSKNPATIAINVFRLRRMIRRYGVSIVHARSRAPAWSALAAARRESVAFVTTYHGTYNTGGRAKEFYNSVMARGDRVIANSQFIADHISRQYPEYKDRVTVVHRGTDMKQFNPDAVSQERLEAIRSGWGVGEGAAPVVLLPGRLTRWKGQLLLIEALKELRDKHGIATTGILAGDAQGRDAYVAEVWSAVEAAGLKGAVRMVGHASDMPAACLAADVVVSTSIEPEAFGRIAVEAQAMRRPTIVSRHGGAMETVLTEPGSETGWRVPPGDVGALANCLKDVLQAPASVRSIIGDRARARVERLFSVENMCDRILDLYRELLEEHNKLSGDDPNLLS